MILEKWVLTPRISSTIVSLKEAVIPVASKISLPSLGSLIPSWYFYFLEVLVAGKWAVKKFLRVSETLHSMLATMFSRASSAVEKGW